MDEISLCSTAIARLFSASVVRELSTKGKSPTAARLLRESGLLGVLDCRQNLGSAYQQAFEILKDRGNRHEYIYKAAITQKVVLGIHNLKTASMLNEFRAGNSRADVVVLNGTATAYEIKSERDSLSRLLTQVADYLNVFAAVNVIVGENHLDEVLSQTSAEVGVLVLSDGYRISTRRKADTNPARTSSMSIFEAMNLREVELCLSSEGIETPTVPNTQKYTRLRSLFCRLPSEIAHRRMVETLKKTRTQISLEALLDDIPSSLHSATLATRIRMRDHRKYVMAFETSLSEAMAWG